MKQFPEEQHAALLSEIGKLDLSKEFHDLVKELGPHGAICRYLQPDGKFPPHLLKLDREGIIPPCIESLVLQPEWREFFDEPLLIEAATRLQEISSVIA
jgi:hypothetical protein